jgi:hypothetical protein
MDGVLSAPFSVRAWHADGKYSRMSPHAQQFHNTFTSWDGLRKTSTPIVGYNSQDVDEPQGDKWTNTLKGAAAHECHIEIVLFTEMLVVNVCVQAFCKANLCVYARWANSNYRPEPTSFKTWQSVECTRDQWTSQVNAVSRRRNWPEGVQGFSPPVPTETTSEISRNPIMKLPLP